MMRIYATADIHGRPERIDVIKVNISRLRPDVLVVAGDITNYSKAEQVLAGLNDMPVPVLVIRGNTDRTKVDRLCGQYPNMRSLHLEEITIKGIPFVGVGGTIPIPFASRLSFRERKIVGTLEGLITGQSVLVAHPPPRGILDEAFGRFHAGCRSLKKMIETCRPRLVLCGHIHERRGTATLGETLVVNCSMGREGGGAIIEFGGDGNPHVKMI